jgi:hypothetical protein
LSAPVRGLIPMRDETWSRLKDLLNAIRARS